MSWELLLSDTSTIILTVVGVAGVSIAALRFIQTTPIRITARAKIIGQLEHESPTFAALRVLFGFRGSTEADDWVSKRGFVTGQTAKSWDHLFVVERMALLGGTLALIPVCRLLEVPWYQVTYGAIFAVLIYILLDSLLYRRIESKLDSWNPRETADQRAVYRLLDTHYSLPIGVVSLYYLAGFAPVFLGTFSSPTLTVDQTIFVAFTALLFALLMSWAFFSEFLDSRERLYDSAFKSVRKSIGKSTSDCEVRVAIGQGPLVHCFIDAVGDRLCVTDQDQFHFEFEWPMIVGIGVKRNE